jgi:hypothetical protein
MALTKITKTGIGSGAVDGTSIEADSITQAKIADGAIENEHLNTLAITGQTELAETAADDDVLLVYDTNAGVLKKISAVNIGLQPVTLSSVSPTNVLTGDGTGNQSFVITGTGFSATSIPTLITDGGSSVSFDSFTINNNTQITAVIAKSSLSDANEPYDVKVQVAGALNATLDNAITVDESPTFITSAGSLGDFPRQTEISPITIEAYDPDSAGVVGYEIIGSLPAGLTSSITSGILTISGTLTTDVADYTVTNFSVKANDVASNVTTRAFSIGEVPSGIDSFTSSGTFSVPGGVSVVDVLVVAGGGGAGAGGAGAGGLIYRPGFPVTPGGTISVTVGDGGSGTADPRTSGQDSVFGTLTAKGGGRGSVGEGNAAQPGGSGGGGNGFTGVTGGTATQPTQPGDSGAYGFGNPGGNGNPGGWTSGAGGGGAGAAGSGGSGPNPSGPSDSRSGGSGGAGGIGRTYTIADGTTPVYYAGGGGGGSENNPPAAGGQGGGGTGKGTSPGTDGGANKGGGAGAPNFTGGKGIVIVSY